jgi:hypothetical protein
MVRLLSERGRSSALLTAKNRLASSAEASDMRACICLRQKAQSFVGEFFTTCDGEVEAGRKGAIRAEERPSLSG